MNHVELHDRLRVKEEERHLICHMKNSRMKKTTFGWDVFPLGQGEGCAQLDWMDFEENYYTCLLHEN